MGYYPARIQAIVYSLFRIFMASLPLLVGIYFHYHVHDSYNHLLLN